MFTTTFKKNKGYIIKRGIGIVESIRLSVFY